MRFLFFSLILLSGQCLAQKWLSLEEALVNPKEVTHLSLKKSKLKKLPDQLYLFTNLQALDLSKNKIENLSDSVWTKLKSLHYINVSQNKLKELPLEWSELPLDTIIASRNELEAIPESYVLISSLVFLDIWSNNLDWLPLGFNKHPSLKTVDMRGIAMNDRHRNELHDAFHNIEILTSPTCDCPD